jgi:hypothetical protein
MAGMSELADRVRTPADVPDTTLIEFMLARLDEEQQSAEAAVAHWAGGLSAVPESIRQHVAQYSPDRVLADVEARRAVVVRYERSISGEPREYATSASVALPRLTLAEAVFRLATVYSGHPEYRDAWSDPYVRENEWRYPA